MADLLDFGVAPFDELLPARLRGVLSSASVTRDYVDGQLVHSRGDQKPGLSMIRSGAVRMCNVGSDGSVVTTAILGPGQVFGEFTLLTDLPRTHDAIAVGATTIDQLGRRAFERAAKSEPELIRMLAASTALRLHSTLEFLDDFRRLPLPVLIAKLLLGMSNAAADETSVRCSHSDLSTTLGVSRVSVGKVLKTLQSAGLIEQCYGRIDISSRRELASWIAERDYLFRIDAR